MPLTDDEKRIALLSDLYKKLGEKMKLRDSEKIIALMILWYLYKRLDVEPEIVTAVKEILEMLDSMQKNQKKKVTKSEYINFVNVSTKSGVVYFLAIGKLEKQISEQIFDTYTLDQLEVMKKRLLENGDLYDFNVNTSNRTPSAAIGKLIDFYRIIWIFRVMEDMSELILDSIKE